MTVIHDFEYMNLMAGILEEGESKSDRTGTGTLQIFGAQLKYDLRKGFPAITIKKLAWKAVVTELLWFLEGSRDERRLAWLMHGNPEKIMTPDFLEENPEETKTIGLIMHMPTIG